MSGSPRGSSASETTGDTMDLGIAGRRALVCASTGGLGLACAEALAREGVHVFMNGRDADRLAAAVRGVAERTGGGVSGVAADVTTADGRALLMDALPDPDILVTNNAGPPPSPLAETSREMWLDALESTMLAQLDLISATLGPMRERGFGRIVNITSAMVTTPDPRMILSAGPRAGLTAVMKGVSREVIADGVTINNLLPERFDTPRQEFMAHRIAGENGLSYEQARVRQVEMMVARRLGRPAEFGATCAFLCGVDAGFITGQNLHLDGGNYPALI
ncbi:SDR family oxidoreductase [Pseudonocardia sp. CA-107938]|uniref:SDR family oxidoreductase n=1 Tax=Pseudonocardia sp. CA-107938 TaxID=3240021 RepID=UPI003D919AAB